MVASGGGAIVNVSSILGLVGGTPVKQAGYCASKGGLVNLTRELGAQWARKGVRVNGIAPGWFRSEMTEVMWGDEASEALRAARRARSAARAPSTSSTAPCCSWPPTPAPTSSARPSPSTAAGPSSEPARPSFLCTSDGTSITESCVGLVGQTVTTVRSSPKTISPAKASAARATHSASEPGAGVGHLVGEDQRADPGPLARSRRPGDGRVVVDRVEEALDRDLADQVLAQHGLHVGVGAGAQLVEPGARARRRRR